MQKVLVIGYGSIGKRHVKNLCLLGLEPYVLTAYPERKKNVRFIKKLEECGENIQFAIISTLTSRHKKNFVDLIKKTDCRNVLIEKPIENTIEKAFEIKKVAKKRKVNIFIAYNLRFLKVFDLIKEVKEKYFKEIKLVKICAGQYLPHWRPYKDYKCSYSAFRKLGGGVDLDLSHEIDYMLWLFGYPKRKLFTISDKISNLKINSPDYFKGIYKYPNFIVDIELDYIRKRERKMDIIGEDKNIMSVDFVKRRCKIMDKSITNSKLFNLEDSYIEELKEFLNLTPKKNLSTIDESIQVLKMLRESK